MEFHLWVASYSSRNGAPQSRQNWAQKLGFKVYYRYKIGISRKSFIFYLHMPIQWIVYTTCAKFCLVVDERWSQLLGQLHGHEPLA